MLQPLSEALAERGYATLTAVQEAVTDPALQAADLLVSAQTGSGKTVGFGLAIAHTLMGDDARLGPPAAPLALVVAPTRELALQVMRELGWLYAKAGARVVSCVGGMDMRDERRALERGAHIVVGTPGRLRDHIQRGSLDMSDLRAVVLDEADEMLDLGFREDLEFMLGEAPEDRRTLMFSATVPPMIAKLAQQYQRDAVRVTTLAGASQHADISYQALQVNQIDVENAIINVLLYHDAQNAIVFANTRAAVNRLTARLANRSFAVVSLSGELSQSERTHALQAMRDGRARVCVATDVAARGIDLPNLDLVIHAELPSNAEGLLHRSGRTGRAGRKGISALIVPPKIARIAERLMKTAKIEAEWTVAPSAEEILRRDEERLLADPAWDEEATEAQADFAARLLEMHAPEKIAAAYLRLYRARQSAPEDLTPPDAKPVRRDQNQFGPSVWFALSVGRDDRAEARWLLPLLCRAGNLRKEAIGAIRVQQSETFVELAEQSVSRFLAMLGEGGELEEGITARQLAGAPDFAVPGAGPKPASRRAFGSGPKRHQSAEGEADQRPAARTWSPHGDAQARPKAPSRKTDDKAAGEPAHRHPSKPAPFAKSRGSDGEPTAQPARSTGKPAAAKGREDRVGKPSAARPGAADAGKRFAAAGKPGKAKAGKAKPGKSKSQPNRGDAPPKRNKH